MDKIPFFNKMTVTPEWVGKPSYSITINLDDHAMQDAIDRSPNPSSKKVFLEHLREELANLLEIEVGLHPESIIVHTPAWSGKVSLKLDVPDESFEPVMRLLMPMIRGKETDLELTGTSPSGYKPPSPDEEGEEWRRSLSNDNTPIYTTHVEKVSSDSTEERKITVDALKEKIGQLIRNNKKLQIDPEMENTVLLSFAISKEVVAAVAKVHPGITDSEHRFGIFVAATDEVMKKHVPDENRRKPITGRIAYEMYELVKDKAIEDPTTGQKVISAIKKAGWWR